MYVGKFMDTVQSTIDNNLYTGCTKDLADRIKRHNSGKVPGTKDRKPLDLIYYEACVNKHDAYHREKYLKTAYGKQYIKNRLKNYFMG